MLLKFKFFTLSAVLFCLTTGVLLFVHTSQAEKIEHWITVDENELAYIQNALSANGDADLKNVDVQFTQNGIAVLRLDDPQMENLSRAMHEDFHKCSGFMAHESRDEAVNSINRGAAVNSSAQFVDYTIDNQSNVSALLAEAKELDTRQVILDLSAFPNRRYNQPSGLDSANWIKNKWTALAAGRSDASVAFYNHPTATSPQPSVILTIQGTTLPNEIVVLGAHQDSINSAGATASAPGADDDASGVAALTEAIRVLMAKGFRPKRTIKFMAYAAEEVGLRGSAAIAADFRAQNLNVVGVLQLDMTNYKGSTAFDIVLIQDFTNAAQNTFVQNLVTTYQPALVVGTSTCGYACSDHASWHNQSYPASMPFEATLQTDNPTIHTANDTIAQSGNNANHALKFSKLALSFVGELGKGANSSPRKPFIDFDGDTKTDISIYRPAVGEWWINRSSSGQTVAAQFGNSSDKTVPADFTGDGKTDIAFFRPSSGEWFILRSEDSSFLSFSFGTAGDIPVVGDFDADGKADVGVFRPASNEWFIQKSSGGTIITTFGVSGDLPVTADYDGDGKTDIAIYRPSSGQWWIAKSGSNSVVAAAFGTSSDKPVQGDYSGDGKADIAFWRPSTGEWFILRSEDSSFYSVPFGASGDIPAPGDYDGDGKFDPAVFRPSGTTWFVNRSTAGILITAFGTTGDRPIPSAFVP
jgi:leucyl aminopeptidase